MTLGRAKQDIATFENISAATSVIDDVGDVISRMWEGLDADQSWARSKLHEAGKHLFRSTRSPGIEMNRASEQNLGSRVMVLLGLFDSGTHLLLETLRSNYQDEVHKACDWDHVDIDNDRFSHCRVWKHGLNISDSNDNQGGHPLYTVLARQGLQLSEVVVVMMVRSPLSTMVSWTKAPYDLGPCLHRPMPEFGQPCFANGMTWAGAGLHDHVQGVQFSSTSDAYNRYTRMYQSVREDGLVHKALLVSYEDLVLSPADVVDGIAEAMGWPRLASVQIIDAPAKPHGAAVGREAALQKLHDRSWLTAIPEQGRCVICQSLDKSSLTGIVDNQYVSNEPSRSYMYDCEGYE